MPLCLCQCHVQRPGFDPHGPRTGWRARAAPPIDATIIGPERHHESRQVSCSGRIFPQTAPSLSPNATPALFMYLSNQALGASGAAFSCHGHMHGHSLSRPPCSVLTHTSCKITSASSNLHGNQLLMECCFLLLASLVVIRLRDRGGLDGTVFLRPGAWPEKVGERWPLCRSLVCLHSTALPAAGLVFAPSLFTQQAAVH